MREMEGKKRKFTLGLGSFWRDGEEGEDFEESGVCGRRKGFWLKEGQQGIWPQIVCHLKTFHMKSDGHQKIERWASEVGIYVDPLAIGQHIFRLLMSK